MATKSKKSKVKKIKTYAKTHKSPKALRSHLSKIRKRGGKAVVEDKTIEYKFQ